MQAVVAISTVCTLKGSGPPVAIEPDTQWSLDSYKANSFHPARCEALCLSTRHALTTGTCSTAVNMNLTFFPPAPSSTCLTPPAFPAPTESLISGVVSTACLYSGCIHLHPLFLLFFRPERH